jgi:hypothetical protein
MFTSLIQRIECPRKRFFRYRLQFSRHKLLIDETAPNLVPFMAIFNLGNESSQPALNQGSRVDGLTRRSLVSPKTRRQRPKNALVHRRAEDTTTNFPESQA